MGYVAGKLVTSIVLGMIVFVTADVGQQDCRHVASYFNTLHSSSEQAPREKIQDTELEVCKSAGGTVTSKTCCTRTIERRLHQVAVEESRTTLESLNVWKRMVGLEPLTSRYRDDLRQQLVAAANITSDELQVVHHINDSECRGCVTRLFNDLADHIRVSHQQTVPFDFRSLVARMLDSLFATVFFRHVQQSAVSSGGGSSGTSGSRSSSSNRQQHYQQQQQYLECVGSVRRQLERPPLHEIEIRLAEDLGKSIGLTQLLLEAYDLATDTIRRTTRGSGDQSATPASSTSTGGASGGLVAELLRGHQCSRALMRMGQCALCDGHAVQDGVKPCRGLCLNVVRGCLAPLVAGEGGLGHAWDVFVDAIARLEHSIRETYDLDLVLAGVASRLSKGIGDLQQTIQSINSSQIASKCGHYAGIHSSGRQSGNSEHTSSSTPPPAVSSSRRNRFPRVMVNIRPMALALAGTNGFFVSRLPETFCRAEGIVSTQLDRCWNGTAFDRYAHAIVPMNIRNQVDENPEMRVAAEPSEGIAAVTTRLGNMTKLIVSQLPPKRTLNLHAFVRYVDESDYSGDDDYDDYAHHGGNFYPIDDEDGNMYESGSGSGEGMLDELPPSVAATSAAYPSVPEDIDLVTRPSASAPKTTGRTAVAPSSTTTMTTKTMTTKHHDQHPHHRTTTTRRPPESPKYEKPAGGSVAVFDGLGARCIRVFAASIVAIVSALLLRWPL